MGEVRASQPVELPAARAEALWSDHRRWPTFVDGFGRVVDAGADWPDPGSKVVWESKPNGRGRVTEKVLERSPGRFATEVFEEQLTGTQTAIFDGYEVTLVLEYDLTKASRITDFLFIRRLLRQSLERTLSRFALEAAEEAAL